MGCHGSCFERFWTGRGFIVQKHDSLAHYFVYPLFFALQNVLEGSSRRNPYHILLLLVGKHLTASLTEQKQYTPHSTAFEARVLPALSVSIGIIRAASHTSVSSSRFHLFYMLSNTGLGTPLASTLRPAQTSASCFCRPMCSLHCFPPSCILP